MAAGFDANIILQALRQGPSALDTMQQLQGMQQARQAHESSLAGLLRRQQQEEAEANVYRQNAGAMSDPIAQGLMSLGRGKEAMGWMGEQSEIGRRKASEQSEIAKMLQQTREELGSLLYGTKDQADYEARLSTVPEQERRFFPSTWDEARPLVESIAIPPAERAKMAHQGEQLKETKRHHEAMEKRPVPGMLPMPYAVPGEGGVVQVIPDLRDLSKPVLTPRDAAGKPIVKPSAGAKPLPKTETDELASLSEVATALEDLSGRFKDSYAGKGPTGALKQAYGQTMGSTADQDTQDFTEYWADFSKWIDLPDRNKTFGASLSAGEKASWEGAKNINYRNDPKRVRAQIEKMARIAREKLQKRGRAAASSGYVREAIEEYTGPLGADEKPAAKPSRRTSAPTPSATANDWTEEDERRFQELSGGRR